MKSTEVHSLAQSHTRWQRQDKDPGLGFLGQIHPHLTPCSQVLKDRWGCPPPRPTPIRLLLPRAPQVLQHITLFPAHTDLNSCTMSIFPTISSLKTRTLCNHAVPSVPSTVPGIAKKSSQWVLNDQVIVFFSLCPRSVVLCPLPASRKELSYPLGPGTEPT